jgi:hypothetical protein
MPVPGLDPGIDPRIHVFPFFGKQDVDGRVFRRQDGASRL